MSRRLLASFTGLALLVSAHHAQAQPLRSLGRLLQGGGQYGSGRYEGTGQYGSGQYGSGQYEGTSRDGQWQPVRAGDSAHRSASQSTILVANRLGQSIFAEVGSPGGEVQRCEIAPGASQPVRVPRGHGASVKADFARFPLRDIRNGQQYVFSNRGGTIHMSSSWQPASNGHGGLGTTGGDQDNGGLGQLGTTGGDQGNGGLGQLGTTGGDQGTGGLGQLGTTGGDLGNGGLGTGGLGTGGTPVPGSQESLQGELIRKLGVRANDLSNQSGRVQFLIISLEYQSLATRLGLRPGDIVAGMTSVGIPVQPGRPSQPGQIVSTLSVLRDGQLVRVNARSQEPLVLGNR